MFVILMLSPFTFNRNHGTLMPMKFVIITTPNLLVGSNNYYPWPWAPPPPPGACAHDCNRWPARYFCVTVMNCWESVATSQQCIFRGERLETSIRLPCLPSTFLVLEYALHWLILIIFMLSHQMQKTSHRVSVNVVFERDDRNSIRAGISSDI